MTGPVEGRPAAADSGRGPLRLSIVVATFNRTKDLHDALSSVLSQTRLPEEVLIVDDSTTRDVEELITTMQPAFGAQRVSLRYLRNPRERGLTTARNVGIEHTTGDVLLFLDDDVVLDRDYLRELRRVYAEHPEAAGVQGHWIGSLLLDRRARLGDLLCRVFFLPHRSRTGCAVLPSVAHTYPITVAGTEPCAWLSGCNQSYRRAALGDQRFDENLTGYAVGEDLDFSYGLFKRRPGSLYITGAAQLVHKWSTTGRRNPREAQFQESAYTHYLFWKHMRPLPKSRLMFLWSQIGRGLLPALMKKAPDWGQSWRMSIQTLRNFLAAEALCLRHRDEVRRGDFRFLRTESQS